ncbi:MAG: beta-glucosidase, partial [Sphingomonadales bacterium]
AASEATGRPANPDFAIDSARYRDVDIGPLFPFGHGLAYSSFDYGAIELSGQTLGRAGTRITIPVTNSGAVEADEVVQLYVRVPRANPARPVKELRGFARLTLAPGQTRRVTFTLTNDQVAGWIEGLWTVPSGRVELMIGSSSADIRARAALTIGERPRPGSTFAPAAAIETKVEIA